MSMGHLPRRLWHEMTTEDFSNSDTKDWIAVLPIAATEQHGPHLPLGTDALINHGCLAVAMQKLPVDLPVSVLPALDIGKSTEHLDFPGTLDLRWTTLTKQLLDIGESVSRSGLRKLVIINAHGGNQSTMETVARELRAKQKMLCVFTSWHRFGVPDGIIDDQELAHGIHGGQLETAMMLALRPDLVRMEKAQDFQSNQTVWKESFSQLGLHGSHPSGWMAQDLCRTGVVGDASKATSADGHAIINHQATGFVRLLQDVHCVIPDWFDKA